MPSLPLPTPLHRGLAAASALALGLALAGPAAASPQGGGMAPYPGGMAGHHDHEASHGAMPMQGHGQPMMGGCGGMGMHMHGGGGHSMGHPGAGPGGAKRAARAPAQVTVVGVGEAGIAPDLAVVSLGVMVQAPTASEAMAQNSSRQQAVIDALSAGGVEGRDIQTSGLGLSAIQDYSEQGRPPVITGYQASNVVTVRVRALDRLGPLLDAVITAGANEIQGISFRREDGAEADDLARRRAVESARARAETIAEAAGMRLGRLVTIGEESVGGGPRPMMMERAMAQDAASVPVQGGEVAVSAQVTAVWELLPDPDARRRPAEPEAPRPVGPQGPGEPPVPMPDGPADDAAPDAAASSPPVVAPAPAPAPDAGAQAPAPVPTAPPAPPAPAN